MLFTNEITIHTDVNEVIGFVPNKVTIVYAYPKHNLTETIQWKVLHIQF